MCNDSNLINQLAEYTNSQNAISSIDLKALTADQIEIEQFLDAHHIGYARMNGNLSIPENKIIGKLRSM